jgi:hypothetical protein
MATARSVTTMADKPIVGERHPGDELDGRFNRNGEQRERLLRPSS